VNGGRSNDLWDRICAMPRPHKVVDFPRKGADGQPVGQIAIWVLTQQEQEACAAEANKKTRELLKDESRDKSRGADTDNDLYRNLAADEVLYRACRTLDLKDAFFPSASKLREKLSVDEVGVLITHYYSVQSELGPIISSMSKEESEAMLDTLKRTGERYPLDSISREQLTLLLLFSVSRTPSSSTDTSLPGSPRDESSSESSSEHVPEAGGSADAFEEPKGSPDVE
jgi:hypothetical protein